MRYMRGEEGRLDYEENKEECGIWEENCWIRRREDAECWCISNNGEYPFSRSQPSTPVILSGVGPNHLLL